MKRLDYFKRELNNILDRQLEALEKKTVAKSFSEWVDIICKSSNRSHLVAKRVQAKNEKTGKVYMKTVYVNPDKVNGLKKYHEQDSNNAKIAIGKLKKQIDDCKTEEELYRIVLRNMGRFSDENNKPLPVVEELRKYVKDKKVKMNMESNDTVEKNTKGQLIYDNYNSLTEEQRQFVINDLLSRDYKEIGNGIFAETERKEKLGDKTFEKEFVDCQILRQIGFEKLYMLPQQYCVRTNGQTGNNTDTFAFKNGERFDFIELKNLDESNIESLQRNYTKSLKQARNVFIQYDKNITDDDFVLAIYNKIKGIKNNPKLKDIAETGFEGNVFLYKSKENEVIQLKITKNGLEDFSSPGEPSSQKLLKAGVMVKFRFSINNIAPKAVSVNNKDVNKSINPYWKAVGI